ncbi:MAG: alpha/beta fold hydrolase [Acidobacteriota bacterium]|jgi:dipeptidyl aminopeptidase/acylaminoacyl peptidase
MPTTETFVLTTPSDHRLNGFVDLPDQPGPRPAIVICHGFKGFMEWGFFPHLARLLADRGFVTVRFNFSGSGMQPGEDRVSDPEAFRANTFSREQEDLRTVLEAVGSEVGTGRADPDRLGLVGHSRGGGAAVLAAAEPSWRDRIGALVTWAAVATFDRVGDDEKTAWRSEGELTVVNSRTGQSLPMGVEVLDDLEANREALDVTAAAARVRAPWLIVHGGDDESVPVEEARRLHQAAREGACERLELETIDGAGHTFGAVHPFAGPTPHLTRALNATQTWLRRELG